MINLTMRPTRFSRPFRSAAAPLVVLATDQLTPNGYVPPRIDRLGTLAELTQGGGLGPEDGFGGAGDEGSL